MAAGLREGWNLTIISPGRKLPFGSRKTPFFALAGEAPGGGLPLRESAGSKAFQALPGCRDDNPRDGSSTPLRRDGGERRENTVFYKAEQLEAEDSLTGPQANEAAHLRFEPGNDLTQESRSVLESGQLKAARSRKLPFRIEDLDFNLDQIRRNVEKGEAGKEPEPVSQMRIEQLRLRRSLHLHGRKKGPLYVTESHVADDIGNIAVHPHPAHKISVRQVDQLADVPLNNPSGRKHDRGSRQWCTCRDTCGKEGDVQRSGQVGWIDESNVTGNVVRVRHLSAKERIGPGLPAPQDEGVSSPSKVLAPELLVTGNQTVGNRDRDVTLIEG